ncbi:hypothetical protein ACFO1B_38725 [Dactylosporangium siamense]|uniref:Uncharacterized protein n=1 Tax=Dactylosporangium siamense TaxID=685454 RepID=A0A919PTQ4_9ACTN|nr:hypothetical protein [Dactylosporangium siamense]GIG50386.1 hypothetical protein Dsi01nite_084270 [Dactylosporangium siamense]
MAVRFSPGSVFLVPAGEHRALAVMTARSPYLAFYACRGEPDPAEIEDVCAGEPLFVVAVMRSAYSSGHWGRALRRLPETALPAIPPVFMQDIGSGACSIVEPGQSTRLMVPREQCIGLERYAVWSADHVESRLSDHYDERPNLFVESLKVTL